MHGEPRSEASEHDDHVNLANPAQVERWAAKLGTTAERVRELVARVGPRLADLEAELRRPDNLD